MRASLVNTLSRRAAPVGAVMLPAMTLSPAPTSLHFNPADPAYLADPHPTLRRFREEAPVHYWAPGQGYIFFRHRDVAALLREPRLVTDGTLGAGFAPELRAKYPDFVALRENDLFSVAAEAHARIRKLVNPVFNPRALTAHQPMIVQVLASVLAGLPRAGTINAFAEFARHYPVRVIAGLLGVAPGDEPDFVAFADALIATILPGLPPEVFDAYMPAISRGAALIRANIAERRAHPHNGDLLGLLIDACDGDARLSDGELLSLVSGILIGGSDTTVHLTTYALHTLLEHPDQLALLRAEPGLTRQALDEVLRFNSFGSGPGLVRFARESFTHEGVLLHRGQPVYLNLMSAFRDPEFLPDAEVFDIRRRINASPWFGYGPHFCLGAALARLEAETALQMFLDRYPRVELAGPPVYGRHPVLRDMIDLPLRVGPAA